MNLPAELGLTAFLVALVSGAASFLSPCILPLLPAYLSFVSGVSVEEVEKGGRRVLFSTLGFVLGFSLVFTALGAGFSLDGRPHAQPAHPRDRGRGAAGGAGRW